MRPVDYDLAYGVYPDMTEHGWEKDEWPQIYEKVKAANILVIASSIWLGDKSSVCTKTIERLYSSSGDLNENGQYAYYGGVGGCLITGNEDGVKHCAMNILYSLQHLGYVIPPQADAGWIGLKQFVLFANGNGYPVWFAVLENVVSLRWYRQFGVDG